MTQAVAEELRSEHSGVHVSMLCPGPVATEFEEKARVHFAIPAASSPKLAEKAVRGMFGGELMICSDPINKASIYAAKLIPDSLLALGARISQSSRKPY